MAEIVCYIYIFHLTWPTSLHYLVKADVLIYTYHWICYNQIAQIWCQSEEGILSRQRFCSEATVRHAQVVWRRFFMFQQDDTPPRGVVLLEHKESSPPPADQHATPSLSWSERDARSASSSWRLCPCTQGTFRARILTILSQSFMTTNNCAKWTIFSLLCANSVVRYFVAYTFQRYVTILSTSAFRKVRRYHGSG